MSDSPRRLHRPARRAPRRPLAARAPRRGDARPRSSRGNGRVGDSHRRPPTTRPRDLDRPSAVVRGGRRGRLGHRRRDHRGDHPRRLRLRAHGGARVTAADAPLGIHHGPDDQPRGLRQYGTQDHRHAGRPRRPRRRRDQRKAPAPVAAAAADAPSLVSSAASASSASKSSGQDEQAATTLPRTTTTVCADAPRGEIVGVGTGTAHGKAVTVYVLKRPDGTRVAVVVDADCAVGERVKL